MAKAKSSLLPTAHRDPYLSRETLKAMLGALESWEGKIRVHVATPMELLAGACKAMPNEQKNAESDEHWSGCDFDTALALALEGWHEALPTVEGLYAKLTAQRTNSMIPKLEYSDEPDGDVDVSRYLEGDDDHWLVQSTSAFTVNVAGTFANLVLNPFASCGQDADSVLKRGTYLVALAYILERAGFRTRIVLRMPNNDCGWGSSAKRYRLEVPLKEYGQMLDLPRLLFWVAHPGCLRQVIIGFYRQYRTDSIYDDSPKQPLEDKGAIVSPPFTRDSDLESWLVETLGANGLKFEV